MSGVWPWAVIDAIMTVYFETLAREVCRFVNRTKLAGVITRDGWWVLVQIPLLALACFLPVWYGRAPQTEVGRIMWIAGAGFLVVAVLLILAGVISLGRDLTPFPRPVENSRLREHGVYGLVRHPIYSGIIFAASGWSLLSISWQGLAMVAVLAVFFDRKAAYEERWLALKFAAYSDYQRRVRKLIPWIY
ncbi:MAG: methyltransferase family protein [Acidiferrobacterales bacterium]